MTTNLSALYGSGGGSGSWKSQTFTTSGVWQRPEGVNVVKVILVAGGGSGGVFGGSGNDGGNSSFGSTLISRGGRAGFGSTNVGSGYFGGSGGGVGTGMSGYQTFISGGGQSSYSGAGGYIHLGRVQPVSSSSSLAPIVNGGEFGLIGLPSPFGSTGGGGGATGNGGNVVGMGSGGSATRTLSTTSWTSYFCGGGGGSYGNGGNGGAKTGSYVGGPWVWVDTPATAGTFGGGGGGHSYGNCGGGGGGEIIIREIPVTQDQVVVIGAGGAAVVRQDNPAGLGITTFTSGAGGNGLCIVFWQE
jgi:hypothetical protein